MNKAFITAVIIAIAGVSLAVMLWPDFFVQEPEPVFCTQEAKLCPDGSYVGRGGPNCEFTACPGQGEETIFQGDEFSFKYPETLALKYIEVLDWPPNIEVRIAQFLCATDLRAIAQRDYCIGEETEGAAGSVYTTYVYNTQKDGRMLTVTLAVRYPQCANYEERGKLSCELERQVFSVDEVVSSIVESVIIE